MFSDPNTFTHFLLNKLEGIPATDCKDSDCAICLNQLNDSHDTPVPVRAHPCNHVFHSTCLLTWLEDAESCPMCRHSFFEDDYAQKIYPPWFTANLEFTVQDGEQRLDQAAWQRFLAAATTVEEFTRRQKLTPVYFRALDGGSVSLSLEGDEPEWKLDASEQGLPGAKVIYTFDYSAGLLAKDFRPWRYWADKRFPGAKQEEREYWKQLPDGSFHLVRSSLDTQTLEGVMALEDKFS
ncbi:hypothetical protein B0J11DRAFT_500659 [Dendryphion nanum]|uniref:RING-type domain-containing protein n=1 Tax=Dendryphion nanum TaxID=256645 RepID=A0A9P9EIS4_9PLEO|nr:hypothetical protein B0J11DRAFT_500659 [Dendryphion nanum]